MSEHPAAPADRVSLDPHSRFRVMDGEGIVILQERAEVLVTNDSGARILELIQAGRRVRDIILILTDEYEVDTAMAKADVEAFVADLLEAGAIRRDTENP